MKKCHKHLFLFTSLSLCSQSGLLISSVADIPTFFHVFAVFFLACSEFHWRLWILIVLSVFYKTELSGSDGWKDGSWCNFFNASKAKREIMVSRVSIIYTYYVPMYGLSGIIQNLGLWKYANHTLVHIMANFWYSCMPYSCMGSLWHLCNHASPYMT